MKQSLKDVTFQKNENVEFIRQIGQDLTKSYNIEMGGDHHFRLKNIEKSLSIENLTLERIWKFARRTRDNLRMCSKFAQDLLIDPELKEKISHKWYEDSRKKVKQEATTLSCPIIVNDLLKHIGRKYTYHRNVAEMERDLIDNS